MRIFISIILLAFFVSCVILFLPGPSATTNNIVIQHGSLVKASHTLEKENIIYNKFLFLVPAKIANYFNTLKAGEYELSKHASIYNIIKKMQSGDVIFHKLSIPEGLTSTEIIEILDNNVLLSGIITNKDISEGSLLPETYYFTRSEPKQILLFRIQEAMKKTIEQLWEKRFANLPLKNKEEFVIMASIVEKEAKNNDDRPKIASVFLNRLKKGMKLQADPTVIYAITQGQYKLDRKLSSQDLNKASLWNTYYTNGLPPTPISNPGIEALTATINPIKTDYLYFVVSDCKGNHAFSSTYTEHQKNVRLYRKLICN
jgi:UPF0755 protein